MERMARRVLMGVICRTIDVEEAISGLFCHPLSGTVQRREPLWRTMPARGGSISCRLAGVATTRAVILIAIAVLTNR
jgi:hypothetical protein